MADPFWTRLATPLAKRILRLLQPAGPTPPAATDAPYILEETIAGVLADGRYVVGGDTLATKGKAALTIGQRVHVLWQHGKRFLILTHQWQRAQGGGEVLPRGVVEGLAIDSAANALWYLTETDAGRLALPGLPADATLQFVQWTRSSDRYFLVRSTRPSSDPRYAEWTEHAVYAFDRASRRASLVRRLLDPYQHEAYLREHGWGPYPPSGWDRESYGDGDFVVGTADGRLACSMGRSPAGPASVPCYSDIVNAETGQILVNGQTIAGAFGGTPGEQNSFTAFPYYLAADPAQSVIVVSCESYNDAETNTYTKFIAVNGLGALRAVLFEWERNIRPTQFETPNAVPSWVAGDLPVTSHWLAWSLARRTPGVGYTSRDYSLTALTSGTTTLLGRDVKSGPFFPVYAEVARQAAGFAWETGGIEADPAREYMIGVPLEFVPSDNPLLLGDYVPSGYPDGGPTATTIRVHVFTRPFAFAMTFGPNPATGQYRQVPAGSMLDPQYTDVTSLQAPPTGAPLVRGGLSVRLNV